MKVCYAIVMMVMTVTVFANETAVKFLKQNEGFRNKVYTCTAGKPTIGYGFTSKAIVAKGTITEEEADKILRRYVEACKRVVRSNAKIKLNENQEAVMIDFVYHFGSTAFKNSTMLQHINEGRLDLVPTELSKWTKQKMVRDGKVVKINGKIQYETVKGLVNRANKRIALWNK